jgi:hypothetical protein
MEKPLKMGRRCSQQGMEVALGAQVITSTKVVGGNRL